MNAITTETRYTPEDLLAMPDGDRYELVDGKLVEHTVSKLSSYVAGVIHQLLTLFCQTHRLGWVFPEGVTYQCFPKEPGKVRKADVSFCRRQRMTRDQMVADGHSTEAPDLAVEVISPNDLAYEVDLKAHEWLEAGVSLVWVVNPRTQTVSVYRPNTSGVILHEGDTLSGEEVIPGFSCQVRQFFLFLEEMAKND
jgi:Uma2 family endonuclease